MSAPSQWVPRARHVGVAACGWAWLFAAAHVYWALGGRIGLTAGQPTDLRFADDPVTYVLSWALLVYLFGVLGLFPRALVWPAERQDRRWLQRAAILAGYIGAGGLAVYGLVVSQAGALAGIGLGISVAGLLIGLLRPQTQRVATWMVFVATVAFGVGMLVYGVSYLVVAAHTEDVATRTVYAITGGVSWTGEGILFIATGWFATHIQPSTTPTRSAA